MNIATKITFAAVTLVLITAAAVGFAVYSGSSALLVKHQLEDLGDQNHIAAARLTSHIKALRQDLQFLVGTPPIQGLIRTHNREDGIDRYDGSTERLWRSRLEVIFHQFLDAKPSYLQIRYIGIAEGGRELVRVERTQNGQAKIVPKSALQKKGQHAYFRETSRLKAGQIYLSEVTLNREQGAISEPRVAVMRASLPVFSPTGALFGMVIINMDFLSVLENVTKDRHFYISNDRGDYLLHENPELSFGFEFGRQHRLQDDYPQIAEMFNEKSQLNEQTLYQTPDLKGEAISFYKAFFDPLHPQRFIILALSDSYQQVIAESVAVRNQSVVLALFLMSIGGGAAWLFSRMLTQPLQQITQAAEQISKGNFDISLPTKAAGELGLLTRGFNHMVHQINERDEALQHRLEELERVNRELDQFAYVTSHDLKAPLRAIANLSQWIEEDLGAVMTPDTQKQMDLLRGRVHRMEALIEGILQYSRVDRVAEEMMEVDIKPLLDEIIENIAPPEGFSIEIAPNMPTFNATKVRLSQVFANLISNAIKYRARDDGRLKIAVKDAGAFYHFSVTDDGPGIAEEYHEKVFKIFQTLQARDTIESTGIGLTLVKKIVEEQGGAVTLVSAEGKGCTFSFTWPKQPEVEHAA